jgi:excisionase family DNA binding protein
VTVYTSYDQLPLALGAEDVAQVLGISRANAYALMHSKGFPTLKIGKRMTVPKDKLIEWIQTRIAG